MHASIAKRKMIKVNEGKGLRAAQSSGTLTGIKPLAKRACFDIKMFLIPRRGFVALAQGGGWPFGLRNARV